MKSMLAVTAIAVGLVTSSLAIGAEVNPLTNAEASAAWAAAHGDGEIANGVEWRIVVDRANAYRLAHQNGAAQQQAQEKATTQSGAAGTNGTLRSAGTSLQTPSLQTQRNDYWSTGHYRSALEVKQDR